MAKISKNKLILDKPSAHRIQNGILLKLQPTDNVRNNMVEPNDKGEYIITADIRENVTEYPLPPWLKQKEVVDILVADYNTNIKTDRKGNVIT